MSNIATWQTALSNHVDDMWLELVNVVTACTQENLADSGVVQFELTSLNDKMSKAKASHNQAQLEECLHESKGLLAYYTALRKQKQRADETGSTFSQLALERLQTARSL